MRRAPGHGGELARFGRVSASTLRDRLGKLVNKGLVDSVAHRLGVLGPHPQRRYFPAEQGIKAGGMAEHSRETFLREYPVSREWFRLLADRLDTVASLYRVAALVADADPHKQPVRVDHYRQGPYDMLTTLSAGRSVGLLRQGPTLPSANLRYRLRSLENLPSKQRTTVTLALTHSDQATRRAVRTLGHPMLWSVPTARSDQAYNWGDSAIAPDAVGEMTADGLRIPFYFEYELRARHPRGVLARLDPYESYYWSPEHQDDQPPFPTTLFVVDTEQLS